MSFNSTSNKFCPNCSTYLHPVEKSFETDEEIKDGNEGEGLYLVCDDCFYHEKAITFSATHFSKKIEKTQYVHPKRIITDYVYEMTFKRTKEKICPNENCPSRGKANPEIILITNEFHPEIAFLCTECKYVWGNL